MKERIKRIIFSTRFIVVLGLIVVPLSSFALINMSEESPLFASISRNAWINGYWFATFVWATILMLSITWITYRMTEIGPLNQNTKKTFELLQAINIFLVFVGCIIFPAKMDPQSARFVHYIHDYLTIAAWVLYVVGLIVYSFKLRQKDKFLGFLGLGLMNFIVFSSIFFILNVIDPASYVGASAVSEVYIINSLFLYLVVMYIAQEYSAKLNNAQE